MSWILLATLVIIATITDIRGSRIPNWVTLTGAAAGILLQLISGGWAGAWSSLIGLLSGFLPLFLLYLIGALGGGDVKLFAAIGAISGGVFALNCAVYSLLIAGLIGIGILVGRRMLVPGLKRVAYSLVAIVRLGDFRPLTAAGQKNMLRFPFMYAVMPAVLLMAIDQLTGKGWTVL